MKIVKKDLIVEYKDDYDTKNAVFNALIAWYMKHKTFDFESIMLQDENSQLEAPYILANIADKIIKFDVKYKY